MGSNDRANLEHMVMASELPALTRAAALIALNGLSESQVRTIADGLARARACVESGDVAGMRAAILETGRNLGVELPAAILESIVASVI